MNSPERTTEFIYVGSPQYDSIVGNFAQPIDPNFREVDLLGAEIIHTGRLNDEEVPEQRIRIYTYHLDNANAADHGQIRSVIETSVVFGESLGEPFIDVDHENASVTEFFYDDTNGFLRRTVDPIGRETLFEHDNLGRLIRLSTPDPDLVTNENSGTTNGPLLPTQFDYRYDTYGNTLQQQSTASTWDIVPETIGSLDGFGTQLVTQTALTSYGYDRMNRNTVIVEPHPSDTVDPSDESAAFVVNNSSSLGHLATSGRSVTRLQYNRFGELEQIVNAENETSDFEYDKASRLTRSIAPSVDVFRVGEPRSNVRPETQYQYFAAGNLFRVTNSEGISSQTNFDGWDRPVSSYVDRNGIAQSESQFRYQSVVGSDLFGQWETTVETYGYTPSGQPELLAAASSRVDAFGRTRQASTMLTEEISNNEDNWATTVYEYYGDDLLRTVIDPRQHETHFQYDALARLEETIGAPVISNADHNENSGPPQVTRTSFVYDAAHQLTRLIDPTGIVTDYTYDALGNIDTHRTYTPTAIGSAAGQQTSDYDYDGLSRLIKQVSGQEDTSDPTFEGSEMIRSLTTYDTI
ncbi:MAG: hypothetical protein AAFN70_09565, partial [Planctomycetota bacterium]